MKFFAWFYRMREPCWYILTHCTLLACAMLASALVVLVWAGSPTAGNLMLWEYADHTVTAALIVLATGVLGAALLEDILSNGR